MAARADRITGNDSVRYLRVSSPGQVETDYDEEGISLPAQRAAIIQRERELNSPNAEEFLEPGRSAKTIEQRPAFQAMMAYLKANPNVRYVFVYALSRFARNRYDDAVMMMHLERLGVKLVSATERNLDDTPAGRAMHGMLAVFNQYQVDVSGEDISYKMGQKVTAHGGTVGRAPVGYKNVRVEYEGRRFNDIAVDDTRAPFVRDAFELYATGEYTETTLRELLVSRGFTTRPTLKRAEVPATLSLIGHMLRNRYYIGEVPYKGQWYKGRHEPLISVELFDQVQRIIDEHSGAGVRQRKYNHYLKGVFWCARCERRMIFTPGKGNGGTYYYFVCSGRIKRKCDQPYVLVEELERELPGHYGLHARLHGDIREQITRAMDETLKDEQAVQTRLRAQMTRRLKELDQLEDRYVDKLGDPDWPQDKLKAKVAAIRQERAGLTTQLGQVEQGLEAGRELVLAAMELLRQPRELFMQLPKPERRVLTLTIFGGLKVDDRHIVGHRLNEPFDALLGVQARAQAPADPTETRAYRRAVVAAGWDGDLMGQLRAYEPVDEGGDGPAGECWDDLTTVDLFEMALSCTDGSSKAVMVDPASRMSNREAAHVDGRPINL
jgi:DNA invertase Pin-like site-specific DNA recombinase